MEEMSKKTKRLEKENINLTRKHDLTNRNILEMAEERTKLNKDILDMADERTRHNKEMDTMRQKTAKLENIVRAMQAQGRPGVGMPPAVVDDEGTESDFDEEEYEEEGSEEEGEYDDDTEDEALHGENNPPPVFGPQPPRNATSHAKLNGAGRHVVNGDANGIKPAVVI